MATLLQELWTGSGNVNGKVPNTGGGTWSVVTSAINYSSGNAGPNTGGSDATCQAVHSGVLTNFRCTWNNLNYTTFFTSSNVYFRSDATIQNCYRIEISSSSTTLYRVVSGASTQIGTAGASINSGGSINVNIVGSEITVRTGTTLLIQTNDSTHASGRIGFSAQYTLSGEEAYETTIGTITAEDAYADVTTGTPFRILAKGVSGSVGSGALSQGDIYLIAQQVWSFLQTSHDVTDSFGNIVKDSKTEIDKRLKKTDFLGLK